jgi:lysophospholipase L1-like esterase
MFMNNPAFSPQADTYYYNLGYDRPWLSPPDLERGFAHMFTSLSWIKAACDRAGIPLLLVILPSRYAFSENQYHRGALRLIANAEAEAKRRGIPFISLRSAFAAGGGDELYFDFCHPKPAGHRVIAQAIYERLRQP